MTWLAGQQRNDGGWGFFGSSDAGQTLDAVFAYVGNGFDPLSVRATAGVTTALDFLEGAAARYTRDDAGAIFPAQTGKLIVGVVASGRNPNQFGIDPSNVYPDGLRLVDDLLSTYQPATGAYSSTALRGFSSGAANATNQAFAILGLAAAQRPIPENALAFLVSLQAEDGRWGSVDTTGLALQALIAGGASDVYQQFDPAIRRGVATCSASVTHPAGGAIPTRMPTRYKGCGQLVRCRRRVSVAQSPRCTIFRSRMGLSSLRGIRSSCRLLITALPPTKLPLP